MEFGDTMILLEKTGIVTPKDDKTNLFFDFTVPGGIEKIMIDYSYSPKTVENRAEALTLIEKKMNQYGAGGAPEDYLPVKNLITLSLNDENGYRGAAHRQADVQHHEISKSYAAAGFIKGEIEGGKWQLALNVHCCACNVHYSLKITGVAE